MFILSLSIICLNYLETIKKLFFYRNRILISSSHQDITRWVWILGRTLRGTGYKTVPESVTVVQSRQSRRRGEII